MARSKLVLNCEVVLSWPNMTSWLLASGWGKLFSMDRVRWELCDVVRVVTLLNCDPEVRKQGRLPAAKQLWKGRLGIFRAVSHSDTVVKTHEKPTSPFCCVQGVFTCSACAKQARAIKV
jgi:hypothetical protein